MKKNLLLLAVPALLLAACKKNDDTPAAPASQRIVGAWMKTEDKTVTSANGAAGQETDNMANDPACIKDDLYNFLSSGSLIQTEGATKCRPQSDPDTVGRGLYSLLSNDTRLVFKLNDSSPTDTFDIVELSGSTLRLKKEVSLTSGNTKVVINDRRTYTRK